MSIINHQRSRISAALKSILRSALGRDINPNELSLRTNSYLQVPVIRGLGPTDQNTQTSRPLFLASDYSPTSASSPLGGTDGKDISRAWAAIREDLDTVDESLTEAERRINMCLSVIRNQGSLLSNNLNSLLLSAKSLETQSQQLFYGSYGGIGGAGQGSLNFNVNSEGLIFPETTGVVLNGGICSLPNQSINLGSTEGSTIAALKLISSTDNNMMASSITRAWAEQPLSGYNQAWSFTYTTNNPTTVTFQSLSTVISALQLQVSQGTKIVGLTNSGIPIPYNTLNVGSYIWLVLSSPITQNVNITLSLSGVLNNNTYIGSISSLTAYTFDFDSTCNFTWGPFQSQAENPNTLYTISISDVVSALPAGTGLTWQISTMSADGPWSSLPPNGNPILISNSGSQSLTLLASDSIPDTVSIGYYDFSLSSIGSLMGGVFTAGVEQVKADAFLYDWSQNNNPNHTPSPSDWINPLGYVRTVALETSSNVYTGQFNKQTYPSTSYINQGTPFSEYIDDQDQDLVYINLKGADNSWTLSPGYNYRFTFSIYTPNGAYLPDIPIGIINPNGAAGVIGVPLLVQLNNQTVYQGNPVFNNYKELSPAPNNYGQDPSNYPSVSSNPNIGTGTSWPPFCGRMTLSCVPGWNTLVLYTCIPAIGSSITSQNITTYSNQQYYNAISANLQPWSGIVMGPSLFTNTVNRYETTGIQTMKGWPEPWTQLSEFDLRNNTPIGMQEVWAFNVDPTNGTPKGILINHNPAASETGFLTLDNSLTGVARNHNISYLLEPTGTTQSLVPGQDPLSSNVWVNAIMSSPSSSIGPLLTSFTLNIN